MSNKIKEITVILPDLRAGGAEKVHLDLINVWIDNGIKVNFPTDSVLECANIKMLCGSYIDSINNSKAD